MVVCDCCSRRKGLRRVCIRIQASPVCEAERPLLRFHRDLCEECLLRIGGIIKDALTERLEKATAVTTRRSASRQEQQASGGSDVSLAPLSNEEIRL